MNFESNRPDKLRVSFEINGKKFTNEFKNEAGGGET